MAIIGVTGRRYSAVVTHPQDTAVLGEESIDAFFSAYARCLAAYGASTVYLPREADPEAVVARLDGVILAGGLDVDPSLYGGEPTERSTPWDRGQDEFDIAVVRAALAAGIPVLGTCRGHEVLNVALGGTLADVPADYEVTHNARAKRACTTAHRIHTADGSLLAQLYGPEVEVNSLHHQRVHRLGEGVEVTATSPDGVIEGIEVKGRAAVGVQWHPEFMDRPEPVLEWLVSEAKAVAQGSSARGTGTR